MPEWRNIRRIYPVCRRACMLLPARVFWQEMWT